MAVPGKSGPVAAWQQVIAHNDFAPYNHVFRDGRLVGAIDFDVCYPASRAWDLAWTAYRYVYLPAFAPREVAGGSVWPDLSDLQAKSIARECAPGAATFSSSYGDVSAADIIVLAPARLASMASWCAAQESPSHRAWGHMYAAHARWMNKLVTLSH
jgi:aminoglycoside phosphotransferase (APT) family kinase protein